MMMPGLCFPAFYWAMGWSLIQEASPFAIYRSRNRGRTTSLLVPSPQEAQQRQHLVVLGLARRSLVETSRNDDDANSGNLAGEGMVTLPKTGISISDEMDDARENRFETKVIQMKELPGVYQLYTTPVNSISIEPVRYLIETTSTDVVMIDVPPYSPELADAIVWGRGKGMAASSSGDLSNSNGNNQDDDDAKRKRRNLRAILLTTRNAIHYDQAPAIYSTRRPDLDQWIRAFPGVAIIGNRMDVPRDCRFAMSQILDGYGPFAFGGDDWTNVTFVETGRPLTKAEWNETFTEEFRTGRVDPDILSQPPDHDEDAQVAADRYSAAAIQRREAGQSILAIYTPGHTFGAMCYVFPKLNVCCTGYTVPCEESRETEEEMRYAGNVGSNPAGPFLDYRGYVTTSQDLRRQMESAERFVTTYVDRFTALLPAYGEPVFLDKNDVEDRRETLLQLLGQYRKLGEVYRQLGTGMAAPEDA
jgi:hypothetical protein